MFNAAVLAAIWIFIGLVINSWWPQWTALYAIGATLLAIPMVIVHSDTLFSALFETTPPATPTDQQLSIQQVNALVTEAIAEANAGQPLLRRYLAAVRSFMLIQRPLVERAEHAKTMLAASLVEFLNSLPLAMLNPVDSPIQATMGSFYDREASRRWNPYRFQDLVYNCVPGGSVLPTGHPIMNELDEALAEIYRTPVHVLYTYQQRLEHLWICGTTGSGKSMLLKRLILHDLDAEKLPSLVIVENAGDVIPWLTRLDHFHPEHGRLRDKLYIFNRDQPPPAINILHRYTEGETAVEDTLSIFRYLFEKFDIDLTGHQGLLFTPAVRFLLTFPETMGRDANLSDLIHLLEVPMLRVYREAAERLADPILREFMLGMFNDKMYEDRKKELVGRLIGIRNDGYLGRMLSTESTGLDLYKLLNEGAIIVIDTAGLGDNTAKYGRLCIALVLKAIFARFTIPEQYRKPTFLYVDEAQTYFDEKTRDLLQNARKFKMGGVFAHQQLADLDSCRLEPYLSGQTSIRLIGRAPAKDWNSLAAYVQAPPGATAAQRHDPEFINRQQPHHFACWIRDVTKQGISVSVDAEVVESAKPMDEDDYEELLLNNRARIGSKEPEPRRYEFRPQEPMQEAAEPTPPPFEPKKRKRPNLKRRGPLTGDIDTSA